MGKHIAHRTCSRHEPFSVLTGEQYIISAYPDRQHIENFDDGEGGQSRYAYYVVSGPGGAQGGYGTLNAAPAQGQFPGQQAGGLPGAPVNKSKAGSQQPPSHPAAGPGPSSSWAQQPGESAPPSYADAVKGDHKVQHD